MGRVGQAAKRVATAAALAAAAVATAAATAVWPATAALAAVLVASVLLAWRAPVLGLVVAVLAFGFEGSVKILLGQDPTPLPGGERAAGAIALDLVLFASVGAVLAADRLRTPRALWSGAGRWERAALAGVGAWLALSVLQIAQGGDPVRGVEGFRLFQAYTVVAAAAAVAVWPRERAATAAVAVLAVGGTVAAYAAMRVALGPSDAERDFALSIDSAVAYDGALRAIGSFSSAVGLISFLTPVAVFALVAGYLTPRLRGAAWTVGALALVGLLGSYGRAAIVAVALGLVFAVVVLVAAADVPRRRKLAAAAFVVCAIGVTSAGVQVASQANDLLRERADAILNPSDDISMNLRLDTWRDTLDGVGTDPLGRGIGAVGAASADERPDIVTTDNSYLKVLLEQGIPVAALFVAALFGLVGALAARLRSADDDARGVGLAALAGFVAFLAVSMWGEYVEQPGKVVAWALLGIAVAQSLGQHPEPEPAAETERA